MNGESICRNGGKRRQFTLEEKMRIVESVDSGRRKVDVAREHGITPSTLSTFLKSRQRIREKLDRAAGPGAKRKRMRGALYDDIDQEVLDWLRRARSAGGEPPSGPLVRRKALDIGLLLGHSDFKGSVGWLNRFRTRYGIAVGDAVNGDCLYEETEESSQQVREMVADCNPEDVFPTDDEYSEPDPADPNIRKEALAGVEKIRHYLLCSENVPGTIIEKLEDIDKFISKT